MKNFKLFSAFLFLLTIVIFSCSEEAKENDLIPEVKLFEKFTEVSDADGNTAKIRISSKVQGLVDEFDNSTLEFRTTAKTFNYNNENIGEVTTYDNEESLPAEHPINTIHIDIIDRKLNQGITGFAVLVKENNETATIRQDKFYAYGSSGVRGAEVTFTEEDRESCWLEVDLERRDAGQNIWYKLADGKLKVPGDVLSYYSPAEYHEYKMRVDGRGWLCTNDDKTDYDFFWEN